MDTELIADLVDGPLLWFLNRSSGIVLLVLLTISTLLGVLSTHGRARQTVPTFVSQALHRNISLLSVLFLLAHATTSVVDTYVDIRWWQAIVPFGGTYQPLWLGLGALASDFIAVVVLTSLVRTRLSHRLWRVVHLASYAAFVIGAVHGLGIGTDMTNFGWAVQLNLACMAIVALAASWRLVRALRGRRQHLPSTA